MRRTLEAADENHIPFLASALTFDALMAAIPLIVLLIVGLTLLAHLHASSPDLDPHQLFDRFLPAHQARGPNDPFTVIESLINGIAKNRGQVSLIAIPAFIWFGTRLFASIRTALSEVFDVSIMPGRQRSVIVAFLRGKARDAGMVVITLLLFLANTAISTAIQIMESRGAEALPALSFLVTFLGRALGEFLAFGFGISLFLVIYKYSSKRKLPWGAATVAAVFAAVAFEIAKRLYGVYLANFATLGRGGADANVGALILFVLWVYYTALVLLLGAVVAETWDLRERQRQQRAVLL